MSTRPSEPFRRESPPPVPRPPEPASRKPAPPQAVEPQAVDMAVPGRLLVLLARLHRAEAGGAGRVAPLARSA
jgi:hypothetical protein